MSGCLERTSDNSRVSGKEGQLRNAHHGTSVRTAGAHFPEPMPFGKYDPEGVIYQAYRDKDVSVIVLLAKITSAKRRHREI